MRSPISTTYGFRFFPEIRVRSIVQIEAHHFHFSRPAWLPGRDEFAHVYCALRIGSQRDIR